MGQGSAKRKRKQSKGESKPSRGLGTTRALSVWFTEEDIAQLKAIAREKGIGHTTLVRMWVREKLKEQGRGPSGVSEEEAKG